MPELPEVEVVRMGLEATLIGARLSDIEVLTPKVVVASSQQREQLQGQRVFAIKRRAKYLIIELSQDCLLIHLRMTGQILMVPPPAEDHEPVELLPLPFTYYQKPLTEVIDKHTHGIFHFENGAQLTYRDVRKFGRVLVLSAQELEQWPALLKLGPEPLGPDFKLTDFSQKLTATGRSIKAFLLDQTKVAGLGNIYVDEALFLAKVRPERAANTLKKAEIKRLFQVIPFVLNKGIDAGGTSLKDYLHPDGQRGTHQDHLFVYGRTGQACLECDTPLVKTVVVQRGTHYCPKCQK